MSQGGCLTVQDLIDLIAKPSPVMIARWIHAPTHAEAFADLAKQLQEIADAWSPQRVVYLSEEFKDDLAESQTMHLMDVASPEDYFP